MATTEVFANNASTTLNANVTTTPAAGTLETWTVVSTSSFVQIGTGGTQQFRCAIGPTSDTNPEIVIVHQINSATTMQVERGAEGSPIKTHNIGDPVVNVITAAFLAALRDATHSLQNAIFTSSGSWTVPTGVSLIEVLLVGGGGSSAGNGSGGGGGGQVLPWVSVPVTPGEVLTITIGAGGAAPAATVTGNAGGNSTVTGTGVSLTANGGKGGSGTTGGNSGSGGIGGFMYNPGGSGLNVSSPPAPGGGGVSNNANVNAAPAANGGEEPLPGYGGGGAYGLTAAVGGGTSGGGPNTAGAANTGGGGGGNTSANSAGFAGGSGYCEIRWVV